MKRLGITVLLVGLAAPLALAQTQGTVWTSDQAHSEVEFSIRHMSVSNVHGHFGKVAATILWNEAEPGKSTVTATIDVSTIDTGVPGRDSDLKSDSFFDAAKFPTATFVSSGVVKDGGGFTVTGNLTLHGVTKPVVLSVEGPSGPVPEMDHKPHAGFTATTTISRTAFGIGGKYPAAMVGDEVKLTIEVEAVKQQ